MIKMNSHVNPFTGDISSATGSWTHYNNDTKKRDLIANVSMLLKDDNKLHITLYHPKTNRLFASREIKINYKKGTALKVNKTTVSTHDVQDLMRTLTDELFSIYTENMLKHFFGQDPFGVL